MMSMKKIMCTVIFGAILFCFLYKEMTLNRHAWTVILFWAIFVIFWYIYYNFYFCLPDISFFDTSDIFNMDEPINCSSFITQNWLKADFTKIKRRNVSETQLEFCPNNVFNQRNLNVSKPFGHPFISNLWIIKDHGYNNTFRSLAKWIFATNFNNMNASEIECGDIVFVKTELIDNFTKVYHPEIKNPYILITHEHDWPVGKPHHLAFLNDTKIIRWYAQNIIGKHPKLFPIPIGIMPPKTQNFDAMNNAIKNIPPYFNRSTLLFLTFSQSTNKNRTGTLKYFKQVYKNNKKVVINEKRLSWAKYLTDLKNSQFVLSPPGNGIDCFRTWESLYLGAVPIVMNTSISALYDDLPVMVVNNWTEVTEVNMMKFKKEKLTHFSKDGIPWRPKAWFRYWMNQILEFQSKAIIHVC